MILEIRLPQVVLLAHIITSPGKAGSDFLNICIQGLGHSEDSSVFLDSWHLGCFLTRGGCFSFIGNMVTLSSRSVMSVSQP